MRFMGGCEQTETFLRLFLIPEVHHGRGPGLTEFDALTALEKWVERGPPPKLIACHGDNGVIERCRPVFPYPDVGSLFRQTRSEGGREFRALRLLPALSSFCGSRSMRLHSGRIVGNSSITRRLTPPDRFEIGRRPVRCGWPVIRPELGTTGISPPAQLDE